MEAGLLDPSFAARASCSAEHQHRHTLPTTSTLLPLQVSSGDDKCNDLKRRKLSPDIYQTIPSRLSSPSVTLPQPLNTVTNAALLYHFAISAHRASHVHLQQAFVHPSISSTTIANVHLFPLYSADPPRPFAHDPNAAAKALDLQLLALDLLRAGLSQGGLSEKEKVAFGLEFGIIGLKAYSALYKPVVGKGKTSNGKQVDAARLIGDIQEIVGQSHFISGRQTSFTPMRLQLELLNARIAFLQNKFHLGKRMIQQALANQREQSSHRYALYLLYLEYIESTGSADYLTVADDLMAEAYSKGHIQVVQLAALAKARSVFVHRRWELASQALSSLSAVLGLTEDLSRPVAITGEGDERTWQASMLVHYMILRSLWSGRIGDDSSARTSLKHIYDFMDGTAESEAFHKIRANGGIMMVTPPNILYLLTYLTTVVSRRDFAGSNATCKSILHSNALRRYEDIARADDMWDVGYSEFHGVSRVEKQQKEVMTIRGEMMLEHATALLFRSDLEAGYEPFAPHICLLFAQFAMLIGAGPLAARFYTACLQLINSGSEFGLIATIGLLGSQGRLSKLTENPVNRDLVSGLVEKCKGSTSAMFNGAGHLLASLTDENVVNSKKQLSTAYEISAKSNNNFLRLLIFAFTTSTHHYGGRERMYRQLETGKELAKMMGGKDRPDGVGQVILGLWFAYRLKEYYRQEGSQERANQAREGIKNHLNRLEKIKLQSAAMLAP
ncbi:uncharacterized protein I206_102865 [Kwoniella pini CBS 10737]|uniref:Uncharacterized protein n=1 Tax=Kwoniella pini CBS 10737 TaxID=1296096 RepID=A0AAJ8MPC4_9TREE